MTIKERPILFSTPMIHAILSGAKTQTRRVVKFLPEFGDAEYVRIKHDERKSKFDSVVSIDHEDAFAACPYGRIGDRLWVRESFALSVKDPEGGEYDEDPENWDVGAYKADGDDGNWTDGDGKKISAPWKPSIFMPRAASRITLEITNVHVERLQEISIKDIDREGIDDCLSAVTARTRFEELWDSINGKKYPWSSNPWLWVVEFKKI